MNLQSAPGWPQNQTASGIPTNLVINCTPEGRYQVARVLRPGTPSDGDFEVIFEGTHPECVAFARQQVKKDSPGLIAE